jgi:hypothetical protein
MIFVEGGRHCALSRTVLSGGHRMNLEIVSLGVPAAIWLHRLVRRTQRRSPGLVGSSSILDVVHSPPTKGYGLPCLRLRSGD